MSGTRKIIGALVGVFPLAVALAAPSTAAADGRRDRDRGDRGVEVRRPGIVVARPGGHWGVGVGLNLLGSGYPPPSRTVWAEGYYETQVQQVLVEPAHYEWQDRQIEVSPGYYRTHHVPPVTETLYDSRGNAHVVVISPGRTEQVWVPAQYEWRKVRVLVPDRYESREVRVWVPGRWVTTTTVAPAPVGIRLFGLFRW